MKTIMILLLVFSLTIQAQSQVQSQANTAATIRPATLPTPSTLSPMMSAKRAASLREKLNTLDPDNDRLATLSILIHYMLSVLDVLTAQAAAGAKEPTDEQKKLLEAYDSIKLRTLADKMFTDIADVQTSTVKAGQR